MENKIFNPECLNIDSLSRLRSDLSDSELQQYFTTQAIAEHNSLLGELLHQWETEETEGETGKTGNDIKSLINAQFLSDIRAIIRKGETGKDSPLAHEIAEKFRNKGNVITEDSRNIARQLLEKATIMEVTESELKKSQLSDSNVKARAGEIVRAIVEDATVPDYIPDKKVFFSALHSLLKRGRGKNRLSAHIATLCKIAPLDIPPQVIAELIDKGNHNDRQATKRAIEKNKRGHFLLSAIALHFNSHKWYHKCEVSAKLGKKHGTRLTEKKIGNVRYVKAFCYDCRTSVYYPVSFNKMRPETMAKRVKRILSVSLAECKRKAVTDASFRIALDSIKAKYREDSDAWKVERARYNKGVQLWINNVLNVSLVPLGAGLGKNVSDRKQRNRIRTR